MKTDFIEQRKHIRIYFTEKQVLRGKVEIEKNNQLFPCKIWGVSMGGLRLSIENHHNFQKGDQLTLSHLEFHSDHTIGTEVNLEVGWVMHQENPAASFMGCRFLPLPENCRHLFAEIIQEELLRQKVHRTAKILGHLEKQSTSSTNCC